MNAQEKIIKYTLQLIEFIFRLIYEFVELIFFMLKWSLKKLFNLLGNKWEDWNRRFIEFIYKRAIQTFNYNNEL